MDPNQLVFEIDTDYAHYQVWDTIYGGRPARVLYSGERRTAQSGVARDDRPDLLFDYNQRMFELVSGLRPERLLLIGGGAYTLPTALLAALPDLRLDVVEIDSGLDKIATEYFGLRPNPRLRIVHGDGRRYLEQNSEPYDVILVDAFVHADTPSTLQSVGAVQEYKRNLTPHGLFARNVISAYHGPVAAALHQHVRDFEGVFKDVKVFPAGGSLPLYLAQNLVLTAQAGKSWPLDTYLRYPALLREPFTNE